MAKLCLTLLFSFISLLELPDMGASVDPSKVICNETEAYRSLCKMHLPRFYYNRLTDKCISFVYGGCGKDTNIFETMVECLEAKYICNSRQHSEATSVLSGPTENQNKVPNFGISKINPAIQGSDEKPSGTNINKEEREKFKDGLWEKEGNTTPTPLPGIRPPPFVPLPPLFPETNINTNKQTEMAVKPFQFSPFFFPNTSISRPSLQRKKRKALKA